MRGMSTNEVLDAGLTESETCSWRCEHCQARNWFRGELFDAPIYPRCNGCKERTANPIVSLVHKRGQ